MPNLPSSAAGGPVVSAAQLTIRANLIVTAPNFGSGAIAGTIMPTQGLPEIYINLFQFPEYNDGATLSRSRNWIAWRPVFLMPANFSVPDFASLVANEWLPMTEPQLLLTSNPSVFKLPCAGVVAVGLEFDTSSQVDAADQGADRIIVSISASQ